MKWNRLLLIPIVLAGLASIFGSDDDNPKKITLLPIAAATCAAASIVVTIAITTKQTSGGDWVTTATGSVTCTPPPPPTGLAGVQVGINWPWNEQLTVTTDSAGNFKAVAKKPAQPSGTAIAGVQPGAPPGGAQPGLVTATSNKL